MLSFRHPILLFVLLAATLPLLCWYFRRRGRNLVLPLDHSIAGRGAWLGRIVNTAEAVPVLLLAVVAVLLAGPTRDTAPETRRRMTNIEFCVDISGSMTARFDDGTRYDASMEAINDFLEVRQGDAFGLTFFGNSYMHWVPLTTDPSAIQCAPPYMRPESAPRGFGGTEIGKALLACQRRLLECEKGDRMILLVSDGASMDLSGGKDLEIAGQLRGNQISVFAIHIGGSKIPDPIVNITAVTGGEVFSSGDQEGLQHVFARIDQMQQTELEKLAAETIDDYVPWCVAGLSLLGVTLVTGWGIRYSPW